MPVPQIMEQFLVWLLTRPLLCNDRCSFWFFLAYIAEEVVAAHVVDNGSGVFMAGFAGMMHFALCYLGLLAGPCCSASWSVCPRRTAAGTPCVTVQKTVEFQQFHGCRRSCRDVRDEPSKTRSRESSRAGDAGVAGESRLPAGPAHALF